MAELKTLKDLEVEDFEGICSGRAEIKELREDAIKDIKVIREAEENMKDLEIEGCFYGPPSALKVVDYIK